METSNAKAAKSAIQLTGSQVLIPESFPTALSRSIDEKAKRMFAMPLQGEQFFKPMSQKYESITRNTRVVPREAVPQNRDTDEMATASRGDGFSSQIDTYNYRKAIMVERTLEEVDDEGVASGRQDQLLEDMKLTYELAFADMFNRGVYVSGSSRTPVLSDDGCFLVDSGRPNPGAGTGTWSNLEATAAISETSLFAASLAARQMTGDDGILYPTKILKMIIGPSREKEMWINLESKQNVGSSRNDYNWANSAFKMGDVIVYDWMTSDYIYFMLAPAKSNDNELFFSQRVRPGVKTYDPGNPDIIAQRIRAAWGLGLGSPKKAWRGGVLA